jgi:phospholipid/cholesterol/gamma-HCH transport system substrate-binding protein
MSFLIGEKPFLFSRTWRLNAPFDSVAGLDEGAAVRAGGVRIGTVEKIELPRKPGEKVTVELKLESSSREVIKKDSVASIETEGLLGSKYVAVSFGSLEGEPVHDGDTIEGSQPLDYADLAKKANEMMDTAKVAIGNINEATGDLKSITSKIDSGQGTIGALVNDKTAYRNLNATTASLRDVAGKAKVGVVAFQENMEALKHNWFLIDDALIKTLGWVRRVRPKQAETVKLRSLSIQAARTIAQSN